jgi:hypothetical protein
MLIIQRWQFIILVDVWKSYRVIPRLQIIFVNFCGREVKNGSRPWEEIQEL